MIGKNKRRKHPIPPPKNRGMISISQYIEKKTEREQTLWRLSQGEMMALFHGHWITEKEFNEVFPPVIVPDFSMNKNNVDKTRQWIF